MPFPADLDGLLREDDWLRRMARKLVGDSHASEDLVQDAWVAAISRGRSERPWLFGVLRNLRREGARRTIREQDARSTVPQPPDSPPADEVVSELLIRKHVTDELLGLDEPFRTVIYLRFVQDESLPAIARRTGVAVSTVHGRIARGLELMRVRLDKHYEGNRNQWALSLLSLAKPPGLATGLIGALAVGTTLKIVAAAVILGGTLALVMDKKTQHPITDSTQISPVAKSAPSPIESQPTPIAAGSPLREAVANNPQAKPELAPPQQSPTRTIRGRVVDLDGLPVVGVRVGFDGLRDKAPSESSQPTDTEGRFEWKASNANTDDLKLECLEEDFVTLLHGIPSGDQRIVVVGRVVDFAGVVVDSSGAPIANATLRLDFHQSLFNELSIPRPFLWSAGSSEQLSVQSDELGRFDLPRTAGGKHVALWANASGFQTQKVPMPAQGDIAMHIVLPRQIDERILKGVVSLPDGSPAMGASVSAGMDIAETDERGEFQLPWKRTGSGNHAQAEDGVFEPEYNVSTLRAVHRGYLPCELVIADLDVDEPIELRLRSAALRIAGRIVDEAGDPRADVIVWASDLTPFGILTQDSGDARAIQKVSIESLNSGSTSGCASLTDKLGQFNLSGLLDREYELMAYDTSTGSQGGPWKVPAGTHEFDLVLETEAGTTRVAGRLVTASGEPIDRAWIVPRRSQPQNAGELPPHMPNANMGTHTDEEGRFEFRALATRGTTLELQHDSFFIKHFPLPTDGNLAKLVIVQPVLREVQVEMDSDYEWANTVKILDNNGEALPLVKSFGAFVGMGDWVSLTEGKTGVFQVLETARTVVLLSDGKEVLRKPIRLAVSGQTTIRI